MKNRFKFAISFLAFSLFLGNPQHNEFLKASSEDSEVKNNDFIKNNYYILGPGDELIIDFLDVPELSGNYKIISDGNIQLPIIGTHNLTGHTLDSAIVKLENLYKNELINPQINIQLYSSRPLKISIIGEVNRPGSYTLSLTEMNNVAASSSQGTSISGFPTAVDAIQKAGGLTFDADITNILIYRNLPGNDRDLKKAKLDLLDLIKTGNQANNPILFDGDVIEISKIDNEIKTISNITSNLTPETIKIYVVGEVTNPGMYELDANIKVNQAILIAGGPKTWRTKEKVHHLRINRNGSVELNKISYKSGIKNENKKLSLRDGDIIKVNKNLFGKSTDVLSTISLPLRDIYSLYGIYKVLD